MAHTLITLVVALSLMWAVASSAYRAVHGATPEGRLLAGFTFAGLMIGMLATAFYVIFSGHSIHFFK